MEMNTKGIWEKFPKGYLRTKASDESGAAMAIALMFLVILSLLGSSALMTSTTELSISGNQKQHKMAFYEADGGTEAGIELIEEAIFQRGFDQSQWGDITIVDLQLYLNEDIDSNCPGGLCKPSDSYRDAFYSNAAATGTTSLKMGGITQLSTGGAIQMIAGYEGKGKGAAGSGAWITYDVRSNHQNVANSESVINVIWRHLM
jgi:hypothetical protein